MRDESQSPNPPATMALVNATFDHPAFVDALTRVRNTRHVSWRQVARETGLEPSTLQRILAGSVPELRHFAVLVDWLDLSADNFLGRSPMPRLDVELPGSQRVSVKLAQPHQLSRPQLQSVKTVVESIIDAMANT